MRKYLVLFVLTILFAFLALYLQQALNPFNEEAVAELIVSEDIEFRDEFVEMLGELASRGLLIDYLNIRNLLVLASTVLLAIGSSVMLVHLIFDRLFIAKFYEQPLITIALRRALVVDIIIITILALRLFAAEWFLVAMAVVLIIIIEAAITKTLQKPTEVEGGQSQTAFGFVMSKIKLPSLKWLRSQVRRRVKEMKEMEEEVVE